VKDPANEMAHSAQVSFTGVMSFLQDGHLTSPISIFAPPILNNT